MRFTNGYWLLKPEYSLLYATEYHRSQISNDRLRILVPCRHIASRGDILNEGTLTVTFTSPMENIVRVCVQHHIGIQERPPRYKLYDEKPQCTISEDEDTLHFTSGSLTASVSKAPSSWRVTFSAGGHVLTSSGYRGMAHAYRKTDGRNYMIDSLELDVGEYVYGFGERFTAYVKNGQTVETWNGDGGTSSEYAYKTVPFYMTNRGYGVFVETPSDVSFEVASEKVERVQFSTEGEELVYDVIYGAEPKDILRRYTALTGRPALPPAWSFGLWLTTSFTTSYDEKTVGMMLDGMAERNIPLHVFHFDCFWMKGYNWCDFCWDQETFPDPPAMLKRLHERGLRVCVWINPYIAQESPLFEEGMRQGFLLRRENGDVWQTDMWQAGMAILDVTSPTARKWYTGYLKRLLDMGVDCFKTDFGERIPVRGVQWADGSDPLRMHNYYTYLYNKMVFDLLEKECGLGEAVLFARSATAGCQQFPVHWGGDNSASYASMAETLRGGLSLSHSGFGFWSHDISGFEQTAPSDVYKRWCAFGMLSSHSRLHGSSSYRVPWLFGEESCDVLREFIQLKMRLMPYLYATAVEAHREGIPMLRPMMLEFPGDIVSETCDQQYMLGPCLLVAPVFHANGRADYWLPEGKWTDLITGESVEGGRYRHTVHDFHTLPLLARENSVVAMGANCDRPDYDYTQDVTLHLFEPHNENVTVMLYDLHGCPAATYTLHVQDNDVKLDTTCNKTCHVILHRNGREYRIC